MVDRNGLWPTRIHSLIIHEAFPGLSANELRILRQASKDTDYVNRVNGYHPQAPEASFVHGMSNGVDNQAPSEAQQQGDEFIQKNLDDARLAQDRWIAEGHQGLSL